MATATGGAEGLDLQELTAELRASWGPTTYRRTGDILIRIREGVLYKETSRTFKAYCRDELDISDALAYQTMKAARFATTVEADAPSLPTPATEYTFRPMGPLPTDSDRLECWRRTVERVAPAAPTHEDVKATVAELEGGEAAGPRTRAGKAPRGAEAEADPVAMLVRGIAGVLREAEAHDDILAWIGFGLEAGGLPPDLAAGGRVLCIRRDVPGGRVPFALAMMCGDPTAMTTRPTAETEEVGVRQSLEQEVGLSPRPSK